MKGVRQPAATRGPTKVALQIGPNSEIDEGVVLGYHPPCLDVSQLIIGPESRIRSGTVIYAGTRIGPGLETGHNVVIRERNSVGSGLRIWSNSVIDYGCTIGENVKIHTNVYVSQFTTIEDEAFIGPGVTLANDIHPGCPDALECMKGPIVKRGAQIGVNSCVLPRVTIGEYAVIGAGSVVTKDIPAATVAYGNPAQVVGDILNLKCTTGMRDKPYAHLTERLKNADRIR